MHYSNLQNASRYRSKSLFCQEFHTNRHTQPKADATVPCSSTTRQTIALETVSREKTEQARHRSEDLSIQYVIYRYVHIFQSNAASKPKSQSFKSTIHGAVPSTEYLIQFPTNQPDKLNKFPRIQPKSSNNESLHSNFQHKRIIANGTSKSARESTKHNSKTHSSRNAASALTTPTDFFLNYSVKRTFHRS